MATPCTYLPLDKRLVYRYTMYYGIHHRKPAGHHARYTTGRQLLVRLGTPHSFHSLDSFLSSTSWCVFTGFSPVTAFPDGKITFLSPVGNGEVFSTRSKVDILLLSPKPLYDIGHNSLAAFTYFGLFLAMFVQIFTGLAMFAASSNAFYAHISKTAGLVGRILSDTQHTPYLPMGIRALHDRSRISGIFTTITSNATA